MRVYTHFRPCTKKYSRYAISYVHTVAPEHNKISVFTKGTSKALNVGIPLGGQILPISIVGVRLAAKKAQKKAKKNITSETINKITPYRKPS